MPRHLLREPHVLAHELRTPLSVLAGWISLIRDGDITPQKCPETWQSAMDACNIAVARLNYVIAEACDEAGSLKRIPDEQMIAPFLRLVVETRQAIDHSRELMERVQSGRHERAQSHQSVGESSRSRSA